MGKLRTYVVSFSPAERTPHGFRTVLSIGERADAHEIVAGDFPTLEAAVRKLALAYGRTCSPFIRLKDRNERAAPGFDRWQRGMTCIDVVAAESVP